MAADLLDRIRRRMRWENVALRQRDDCPSWRIVQLLPSNPAWPSIDLHFPDEDNPFYLDPLAFSDWHTHFSRWSDERRNLVEALRTARLLVAGERELIEELDVDGQCVGSGLCPRTRIPLLCGKTSSISGERGSTAHP